MSRPSSTELGLGDAGLSAAAGADYYGDAPLPRASSMDGPASASRRASSAGRAPPAPRQRLQEHAISRSLLATATPHLFIPPPEANRPSIGPVLVPPPSREGKAVQAASCMLATKTFAHELSKARAEGRLIID